MQKFTYNIDIIEACNLRCPSCPVGNSRESVRPSGRMNLDMFRAIMEKIARETPVECIGLFSWAEPLLHPELPEFIKIVKSYGYRCTLSSNLNLTRNLEEVLRANPDQLRISLSGFYQQTYGRTHRGGDIRKVKSNMYQLRVLMDKLKSNLYVHVGYHKYLHNMGVDYQQMAALCEELGFEMEPLWAFLMPLEKLLDYHEGRLPEKDHEVINLMAVRPEEQREIALRHNTPDCLLRSTQISINADGSVSLCCATYDSQYNISPNFLETPHAELQRRKYQHAMCGPCMENAAHVSYTYGGMQEWDRIGNRRLQHLPLLPAGPLSRPAVSPPSQEPGIPSAPPLRQTHWFVAPQWDTSATWQPVVEAYVRSQDLPARPQLQLYAGPLTDSAPQTAYGQVETFLVALGIDLQVCPDIILTDQIPQERHVQIILSGGALDQSLQQRFAPRCIPLTAWRAAA